VSQNIEVIPEPQMALLRMKSMQRRFLTRGSSCGTSMGKQGGEKAQDFLQSIPEGEEIGIEALVRYTWSENFRQFLKEEFKSICQ
jgi:hypothetical protein